MKTRVQKTVVHAGQSYHQRRGSKGERVKKMKYETPVLVNYPTARVIIGDYDLPVVDTLTLETYGVQLSSGDYLGFQFPPDKNVISLQKRKKNKDDVNA